MLVKYSTAFEVATLMQTNKLERFPLIAVGTEFWDPLIDFARGTMTRAGTVSEDEAQFIHRVDSAEDVIRIIGEAGRLPEKPQEVPRDESRGPDQVTGRPDRA